MGVCQGNQAQGLIRHSRQRKGCISLTRTAQRSRYLTLCWQWPPLTCHLLPGVYAKGWTYKQRCTTLLGSSAWLIPCCWSGLLKCCPSITFPWFAPTAVVCLFLYLAPALLFLPLQLVSTSKLCSQNSNPQRLDSGWQNLLGSVVWPAQTSA